MNRPMKKKSNRLKETGNPSKTLTLDFEKKLQFRNIRKQVNGCFSQNEYFQKAYNYSDQFQSVKCACGQYFWSYLRKQGVDL